MRARQLNLWKIAETEDVDEGFWSIKASDVLMARARLNKNRAPGDDGVVTEMVLLLPLCAMYFVARIFDDRFWGRNEMATSWRSIIMRFLRKELRPKEFRQLRGLCLLSSMMKLFVLTLLCKASSIPPPRPWRRVCSFGFERDKNVGDITGSLQFLFSRSWEWRKRCPLHCFDGDIMTAFDLLSHELADNAMHEASWPARLRANIIDTNMDLVAKANLPNSDEAQFNFSRCFKQGSNEAPDIWKMVIYSLLSCLVPLWIESDWGFEINCSINEHGRVCRRTCVITHFVWVDNLYLVARSHTILIQPRS